jgi:hypothetical protein
MIRDLIFPYPYIIEKMDEYYKPNLPPVKIREEYRTKISPHKRPSKKKLTILIATFWDYPHIGGLSNYITVMIKKSYLIVVFYMYMNRCFKKWI